MSNTIFRRSYQLTCLVRTAGVRRVPCQLKPCHLSLAVRSLSTRGMDKVHEVSKAGFKQVDFYFFSFFPIIGFNASLRCFKGQYYDQNRPSYTDEITLHVVKNLYQGQNTGIKYNILELGAGTGKFTRKLQPHLGKNFSYLATDPSEDFLKVLQEQSPDAETKILSAYDIPLPDSCVQNIVCAQSFHWCANKECLDEITRVLVPQGRLLCVWNNKNWKVDWVKEMEDVLTSYYRVETPRAYLRKWHTAIEGYSGMRSIENPKFPGLPSMKGNKDFVVDHFSSISVISLLEAQENQEARAKFKAVLDKHFPGDQEINIPLFSEYYCAEKV